MKSTDSQHFTQRIKASNSSYNSRIYYSENPLCLLNARPGLKPVVLMKEDALLISPVGICFWCSCLYALAY